ncbi:MAG: histidine--tRNA ligase [Alphaproteobacteria bacterium]|nr:histidine--tRNA ligase [Alphaproteobacteria bacterium]
MTDRKITKPRPISGFPEWLPEVRRVEQQWMDHIRRVFESYGYASIETPAVEELDIIGAKGADVDKEIYVLERLHKEDGDKEARLALHFDQTVPLARYVAQHFNDLVFPFKRYQMQKVWRGERPQAGRFREFYQCDIDVINVDALPLHFDAEMPAVMWEILSSLPGMENEKIQIRVSNRKILMGVLSEFSIPDISQAIGMIDKFEKNGAEWVFKELKIAYGDYLTDYNITEIVNILKNGPLAINNPHNEIVEEGLCDLTFVMDQLKHLPEGSVVADLSIVRGLDYYTGTVYETVFLDDPGYGSICSGGRYDDLAGNYINKHLPGVGISIGLSRLFDRLRQQNKLPIGRMTPTDVLVVLPSEERRPLAQQRAHMLRQSGLNVEVFHSDAKLKRQLAYAERKGIPFVWFPPFEDDKPDEVKNMTTGMQGEADAKTWKPDA